MAKPKIKKIILRERKSARPMSELTAAGPSLGGSLQGLFGKEEDPPATPSPKQKSVPDDPEFEQGLEKGKRGRQHSPYKELYASEEPEIRQSYGDWGQEGPAGRGSVYTPGTYVPKGARGAEAALKAQSQTLSPETMAKWAKEVGPLSAQDPHRTKSKAPGEAPEGGVYDDELQMSYPVEPEVEPGPVKKKKRRRQSPAPPPADVVAAEENWLVRKDEDGDLEFYTEEGNISYDCPPGWDCEGIETMLGVGEEIEVPEEVKGDARDPREAGHDAYEMYNALKGWDITGAGGELARELVQRNIDDLPALYDAFDQVLQRKNEDEDEDLIDWLRDDGEDEMAMQVKKAMIGDAAERVNENIYERRQKMLNKKDKQLLERWQKIALNRDILNEQAAGYLQEQEPPPAGEASCPAGQTWDAGQEKCVSGDTSQAPGGMSMQTDAPQSLPSPQVQLKPSETTPLTKPAQRTGMSGHTASTPASGGKPNRADIRAARVALRTAISDAKPYSKKHGGLMKIPKSDAEAWEARMNVREKYKALRAAKKGKKAAAPAAADTAAADTAAAEKKAEGPKKLGRGVAARDGMELVRLSSGPTSGGPEIEGDAKEIDTIVRKHMKHDLRDLKQAYAYYAKKENMDDEQRELEDMLSWEELHTLAREVRAWNPEGTAPEPEQKGGKYMQESKKSKRTRITKKQIRAVLREALKKR